MHSGWGLGSTCRTRGAVLQACGRAALPALNWQVLQTHRKGRPCTPSASCLTAQRLASLPRHAPACCLALQLRVRGSCCCAPAHAACKSARAVLPGLPGQWAWSHGAWVAWQLTCQPLVTSTARCCSGAVERLHLWRVTPGAGRGGPALQHAAPAGQLPGHAHTAALGRPGRLQAAHIRGHPETCLLMLPVCWLLLKRSPLVAPPPGSLSTTKLRQQREVSETSQLPRHAYHHSLGRPLFTAGHFRQIAALTMAQTLKPRHSAPLQAAGCAGRPAAQEGLLRSQGAQPLPAAWRWTQAPSRAP